MPTIRFALAMALAIFVLAIGTPAQASGYWKYTSYATKPPQSQLDLLKPLPGRVDERRVFGAFQPAMSGAGTVKIFFKTDDADLRVFLCTVEFSFTTGVEMRTLTPGQKVRFKSVLQAGGNALAKALPSYGTGDMAVDNGPYFLSTRAAIDQPGNAEGTITIPGGGPGATMMIYMQGQASSAGALTGRLEMYYAWVEGTPPSQGPNSQTGATADPIGSRLDIQEIDQWKGTWTRRPGTNIFDAVWRNNAGGGEVRDVIRLESVQGNKVVFTRDGNGGRYYGTLNGRTISGTASWYAPGWAWSGTTSGN